MIGNKTIIVVKLSRAAGHEVFDITGACITFHACTAFAMSNATLLHHPTTFSCRNATITLDALFAGESFTAPDATQAPLVFLDALLFGLGQAYSPTAKLFASKSKATTFISTTRSIAADTSPGVGLWDTLPLLRTLPVSLAHETGTTIIVHEAIVLLFSAHEWQRAGHTQTDAETATLPILTETSDLESLGHTTQGQAGHLEWSTLFGLSTCIKGGIGHFQFVSVALETKHVESEDAVVSFCALALDGVAIPVLVLDCIGVNVEAIGGIRNPAATVKVDNITLKVAL